MEEHKNRLTLVNGDFNAQLGQKLNREDPEVPNFEYNQRTGKGAILMNPLEEKSLVF